MLKLWAKVFSYDIFLSYSREDDALVAVVHGALKRRFLTFKDDNAIDHWERFKDRIDRELKRSRRLVVLLTSNALESKFVDYECRTYCDNHAKPRIAPIFVAPVTAENLPEDWAWIAEYQGMHVSNPAGSWESNRTKTDIDELYTSVSELGHGPRQLSLARWAGTILIVTLVGLVVWGGVTWQQARLQRLRNTNVQRATAAEGRMDYAHAAIELRHACDVGIPDEALIQRRVEVLSKVILQPVRSVKIPNGWRLMTICALDGQPRLVLRDVENEFTDMGRVIIAGVEDSQWQRSIPTPHESQPQVDVWGNQLFLATGKRLTRITLNGPDSPIKSVPLGLKSGMVEGGFDSIELAVTEENLLILGRSDKPRKLLVLDPTTLDITAQHKIEDLEDMQTMVTLSRKSGRLATVVRRKVGFDLAVSLEELTTNGKFRPLQTIRPDLARNHVGSLFSLYKVVSAPEDAQMFIAFHQLNLAGAPDRRGSVHWIAVDMRFARKPWTMDPGIERLRGTTVADRFEAVYRRNSKELRALQNQSLVVLDRPGVTLTAEARAWTLDTMLGPVKQRSFRAFVGDKQSLTVYDDVKPVFVSPWSAVPSEISKRAKEPAAPWEYEVDPLKMSISADGRWLAVELMDDRVLLYRHHRTGLNEGAEVRSWPSLEDWPTLTISADTN